MEPSFHGPYRPGDGLGDLVVRQILLMKQYKDQAIFGPELAQGPFDLAGQVLGVGRSGSGVGQLLGRLGECQGWPAAPASQRGAATVGGDLQEPGTNRP